MAQKLLIGAHVSIAGGLDQAIYTAAEIHATCCQIFTANQRSWYTKDLPQEAINKFHVAMQKTGVSAVAAHASYLVNLGSPRQYVHDKSCEAFRKEIERCQQLGISYLIFHPGAHLDSSREQCLDTIVKALRSYDDMFSDKKLHILLETTAGQGTVVGSTFEELAYIISYVKKAVPIGVCMDTCHVFAAGYDIRTAKALKETLQQFDSIIGLEFLHAFHLNDSKGELGSHLDRHLQLGEGQLGLDCFRAIMRNKDIAHLPKYLETPGGVGFWKDEIKLLRSFV